MPRDVTPSAIAITAPRDAPADTPMIPGSAKGFEKTPCITAPASAKAPPTKKANDKAWHADKPQYRLLFSCNRLRKMYRYAHTI